MGHPPFGASPVPLEGGFGGSNLMNVRRYSIEIKDLETGTVRVLTVVEWTPEERWLALRWAMRQANQPDQVCEGEAGPA